MSVLKAISVSGPTWIDPRRPGFSLLASEARTVGWPGAPTATVSHHALIQTTSSRIRWNWLSDFSAIGRLSRETACYKSAVRYAQGDDQSWDMDLARVCTPDCDD